MRSHSPNLILMDLQMPRMNGYEATRQIKAQARNQTQNAPIIIALTASALREEAQKMLMAGCDDVIYKPFQAEELFSKMATHLGVSYLYTASAPAPSLQPQALTAADLKIMPESWLQQLHQATVSGDDVWARELIQEVPQADSALVDALSALIEQLRLDLISDLIEPLLHGSD
ncbi:MAG: response regulator [Oscillatoriales cyanobacterium RM2_1_1]|nr:response regulator [Oscillatoriales cyanobacterium RM2_1_1]